MRLPIDPTQYELEYSSRFQHHISTSPIPPSRHIPVPSIRILVTTADQTSFHLRSGRASLFLRRPFVLFITTSPFASGSLVLPPTETYCLGGKGVEVNDSQQGEQILARLAIAHTNLIRNDPVLR